MLEAGIMLLRVLFGTAIAAHGAQKLFGWFGGYGLQGTAGFFEGLGFRPGFAFAALAGLSEFIGGLLVVAGLLTPVGAAAVLAAMIVAAVAVHLKNGFFAMANGIELPYLYAATAIALMFAGGGQYSLDARLHVRVFNDPLAVIALLLLAIAGAVVTLAVRRQSQSQTSSST
ncbi:MAG: DoxX family protein [Pyrinomonadaceae bacterium]